MTRYQLLVACSALLLLAGEGRGEVIIVNDDTSVNSESPSTNYNSDIRLHAGNNVAFLQVYKTYLKFVLPSYTPDSQVTSAVLRGTYSHDFRTDNNGTFSWYLAAHDSWTESTLNWNNQPGKTGGVIGSYATGAVPNQFVYWDITSSVNQEYQGDGLLSLVFESNNPGTNRDLENWWASESGNPPFQLDLTVTETVVPEPSSFVILISLVACLGVTGWRREMLKQRSYTGN